MSKPNLSFFTYFFIISALHLTAMIFNMEWLGTNTKPFLLLSLIYAVLAFAKSTTTDKRWINILIVALGLSCAGDILLLLEKKLNNPLLFYFGLGAFLFAHISYIILYKNWGKQFKSIPLLSIYILYLLFFLYLLVPGMKTDLAIPVVLYGLVLCAMAWSAWRIVSVHKAFGLYVVFGAILFVISDSILAIRKFKMPVAQGDFLIMLTYLAAQFLITWGILNTMNQISTSES